MTPVTGRRKPVGFQILMGAFRQAVEAAPIGFRGNYPRFDLTTCQRDGNFGTVKFSAAFFVQKIIRSIELSVPVQFTTILVQVDEGANRRVASPREVYRRVVAYHASSPVVDVHADDLDIVGFVAVAAESPQEPAGVHSVISHLSVGEALGKFSDISATFFRLADSMRRDDFFL